MYKNLTRILSIAALTGSYYVASATSLLLLTLGMAIWFYSSRREMRETQQSYAALSARIDRQLYSASKSLV